VQWHFEDIIRDPNIDPVAALTLKRRIEASNQERTDMVEYIDGYFLQKYAHVAVKDNAKINSESPAWAFDVDGTNNVLYEATPNNGPLPLNLISFEAEKYETQDAQLTWTTANEENTSHFQIQRSFDKKTWSSVGNVAAAGYSIDIRNYSFMDYRVYNGRDSRLPVYYRLNMVDLDGRQRYSPIESVIFGNSTVAANQFYVYPNPATDGIQVEWDAENIDQPTSLEFYDVTGKLVYNKKVSDKAVREYVDFSQTSIHSGVYLLRIMSGTEPIEHKQVVVGGR